MCKLLNGSTYKTIQPGKQALSYLLRQELTFDMLDAQDSRTDCFTITGLINPGAVVKKRKGKMLTRGSAGKVKQKTAREKGLLLIFSLQLVCTCTLTAFQLTEGTHPLLLYLVSVHSFNHPLPSLRTYRIHSQGKRVFYILVLRLHFASCKRIRGGHNNG